MLTRLIDIDNLIDYILNFHLFQNETCKPNKMALNTFEQIDDQITKSKNILIIAHEDSLDAVAASWGLAHIFSTLDKNPIVLEAGPAKWDLSFLSPPDNRINKIFGSRDFALIFNTEKNKILEVKTFSTEKETQILITPEKDIIDPRDFSFVPAKFKYDLIIALGFADLESLGKVQQENTDLFFEVPIINIDNRSENENFAAINYVELTASSISQQCAELSAKLWEKETNEKAAQCFLTGIIAKTNNFQSPNTSPKALKISAWLIEKGAKQQEIISKLFRTLSFSTVKLWGSVMLKLNWNDKLKFAWAKLDFDDFSISGAKPQELEIVINRLKDIYSQGKYFAIVYPKSFNMLCMLMSTNDPRHLTELKKIFNGKLSKEILTTELDKFDISLIENNISKITNI